MNYLLAVQSPLRRTSAGRFAAESAFTEHLLQLRDSLRGRFDEIVVIAPSLDGAVLVANSEREIDEVGEGIRFVPAYPASASAAEFWRRHAASIWRVARREAALAGFIHSNLSTDLAKPFLAIFNEAASLSRKPLQFVVDIDFRQHSDQSRRLGRWSGRKYMAAKVSVDAFKTMQVRRMVRAGHLVLLKSASMVSAFGAGRETVRNFYDTVHTDEQVLDSAHRAVHLEELASRSALTACYFGRFAWNKGLDHMVEAVAIARGKGHDIRLDLIGGGACEAELRALVASRGLDDVVRFHSPRAYGPDLFELLAGADVMVAAPLIEDTPRAAFDAMARGLPIVAYDISYFRDLAAGSGAVELAEWPKPAALAGALERLHADRSLLVSRATAGLAFAADNTQPIWLERRRAWLLEHAGLV